MARLKIIPRRWLQLRLSTLFIAMAVLCLWLAQHVDRVHREQRAIAELEKAGIYVTLASIAPAWAPDWLDKIWFRYVITVNTDGRRVFLGRGDDPRRAMSSIELFFLMSPGQGGYLRDAATMNDDLMRAVATFKYVKVLNLTNAKISDTGIQHLKNLRCLQVLIVTNTNIGDECLKALEELKDLRCVSVTGTNVTRRGSDLLLHALPDCGVNL